MEYTIQAKNTKKNYLLTETERKFLQNRIKRGYLKDRIGDFLYEVKVNISPTMLNNSINLTEKAKKFIYKYIAETMLNEGNSFCTRSSQTLSLWRGDYNLSITDLKSFKAPLLKNGRNTFICIDISVNIEFIYDTENGSIAEAYATGKYIQAFF